MRCKDHRCCKVDPWAPSQIHPPLLSEYWTYLLLHDLCILKKNVVALVYMESQGTKVELKIGSSLFFMFLIVTICIISFSYCDRQDSDRLFSYFLITVRAVYLFLRRRGVYDSCCFYVGRFITQCFRLFCFSF